MAGFVTFMVGRKKNFIKRFKFEKRELTLSFFTFKRERIEEVVFLALNRALFRQEEVDKRISTLSSAISNMMGKYQTQNYENIVAGYLKRLEERENMLFQLLGITSGTIEQKAAELGRRIRLYDSYTLNLSGERLNNSLIGRLKDLSNKETATLRKDFIEAITVTNEYQEATTQNVGALADLVNEVLSSTKYVISTKGRTSSTKAFQSGKIEDIIISNLTKAQKRRATEFIEKQRENSNKQLLKNLAIDFTTTDNVLDSKISFETIVEQGLTLDYAKTLSEEELNSINNTIKQQISNMAPQANLGSIINYVLRNKPYAFFVGKNVAAITGILGEIQGLFLFSLLMTGIPGRLAPQVKWIGGKVDKSGKQPHADILIRGMGIQIKNTTKGNILTDGLNNISFTSKNLNSFLSGVNIDGIELSTMDKDIISSAYATYHFNIEYDDTSFPYRKGPSYKNEYAPTRERLKGLIELVDKLFGIFSATLMYLDVAKNGAVGSGNILYLLGGTAVTTASLVLQDTLDKLRNKQPTNFHTSSSLTSQQFTTIVDVLNAGSGRKQTAHYIMKSELEKIKLTSSYNFSSLL